MDLRLTNMVGDWDRILADIIYDPEVLLNINRINKMYKDSSAKIYPEQIDVFKAFKACPYDNLKAIIILQDPYHDGSATGLATANRVDQKRLSPSLKIIKDTISREVYNYHDFDFDPTLIKWAKQGVLMLNTALTVEAGKPLSHQPLWSRFTELTLRKLSEINSGIVYCLWGKYADSFSMYINSNSNTILRCTHPVYASYRNQPWDCGHFTAVNKYLKDFNNLTINW
jgi:uracil-DNA glycosylase